MTPLIWKTVVVLVLAAMVAGTAGPDAIAGDEATHGASMLDPERAGGNVDKTWDAVLYFMKSNR